MNKKLIICSLALIGMSAATFVSAATFSMSPANISVTEGQTFSVSVFVNPQGVSNYTEKLELKYSAAALEVKSFNFAGNWMPISQPGYDLLDNASGILIKTAGYPGGFTSKTLFGNLTFRAKQTGNAAIQITTNSMALNADSKNIASGLPVNISAVIAQSAPAKTPVVAAKPTITVPPASAQKQTETKQVASAPEQVAAQPTSAEDRSLLSATIVNVRVTFGSLLALAVVFLVGFIGAKYLKLKKQDS